MNINLLDKLRIKLREKANPIFGPVRKIFLYKKYRTFSIISNNCWGGHVCRYFSVSYNSPTVGLYFFSDDYLRFLSRIEYYMAITPSFITYTESKHFESLSRKGGANLTCPIGVIDDIEIIFLHYKDNKEALSKWERRKKRLKRDNLYIKMSEQNDCSFELMQQFDELPYENKILLCSNNYGLKSQVICEEHYGKGIVSDDTTHFRKYVNLINWINCKPNYKKRQKEHPLCRI